tara:strand:+ start:196 stop:678 length:483 start_codon:yes stop_codon:yes gene_type:complete
MIQAITETNLTVYIQTEDNRINTSVSSAHIRHLLKFTNDLDKSIHYAYGATETIYNRYTKLTFAYIVEPDRYDGLINFLPSGYWKYEAYEVSWATTEISISEGTAPKDETDVLPVSPANGIVQGLVTKGKMYLTDKDGTEQVQYTQRQEPSGTNYIYYGQ